MRHLRSGALCLSLLLVAASCGDVATEPDTAASEAAFAPVPSEAAAKGGQASDPDPSVTGGGHYETPTGHSVSTSVSARLHKDGTVRGQIQIHNRTTGMRFHVDVTCLTVIGKDAFVGGVITSSSITASEGSETGVWILDNGTGQRDAPDMVSGPAAPAPGRAQQMCTPPLPSLIVQYPLDGGNFTVEG